MLNLFNPRTMSFTQLIVTGIIITFGFFLIFNSEALLRIRQPEISEVITPEVKVVTKRVDNKQLKCLAYNVFYEAGSEPNAGKAAVARVTINRVNHGFGRDPCAVVYQSNYVDRDTEEGMTKTVKLCQFSWVCEGKHTPNARDPRYIESERIAYEVLAHNAYSDVVPSTTLFFHNVFVKPEWPYKLVKKIGNHIFYEKHGRKQRHANKRTDTKLAQAN
jgi:spore germination cell wall hydrolase CwlJ-like protein